MRILLDENLPRKLIAALRAAGHPTDSIHTLHLDGVSNGVLGKRVAAHYDVCFTRDEDFTLKARRMKTLPAAKVLRVILPQQSQVLFVAQFMREFRRTNWSEYRNGDDWP